MAVQAWSKAIPLMTTIRGNDCDVMRSLFRSLWRLVYRNPKYLEYSGSWDTVYINGEPAPAKWYDLRHWVQAFKDELYLYSNSKHDELD